MDNFIIAFLGQEKREASLKPGAEHGACEGCVKEPAGRMLSERGGCQVESRLFATFTVPTGEMHEDFKTLKEEIQRETQEVEKLSHVGQSSLLTALSKLLGKKKELQDLELTVRSQWKWAGVGGRRGGREKGGFWCSCRWGGRGGSDTGRR